MKYLKIAEGVSELFPKKVKIQLIHFVTGQKIGDYKVVQSLIPEKFNKPSRIEIGGYSWRIIHVVNVRDASLLFGRKLQLLVCEPGSADIEWRFDIPTCSYSSPSIDGINDQSKEATTIPLGNWRQIEWLPTLLLPYIQEDLNEIQSLVIPENDLQNLKGYTRMHVRKDVFDNALKISMKDLLKLLVPIKDISGLMVGENSIRNGFSFQSVNYHYYGICVDGVVLQLGIFSLESIDEEIMTLAATFDLVLADWCNARIYLNAGEDLPEQDIIQL